ncbi:hypothetical protein PZA11_002939 [Diplocarpon coronariae]
MTRPTVRLARIANPFLTFVRHASNVRQRAVVSSFICSPPSDSEPGLKFALFKRSKDLSTYPDKWAVCSGSIEPTDANSLEAAKREILEETKLQDSDITLLKSGTPYNLVDGELGTEWIIHPFLWQIKEGARSIQIGPEHSKYEFVAKEALSDYPHVPNLEMGLWRVMTNPNTVTEDQVAAD